MAAGKFLTDDQLEERRVFVMDGRKKAWSFYRIAREVELKFGYPISAVQCSQDYKVIMRRRTSEMNEELDAQRNSMLDQIDGLLEKHLELAVNGDTDAAEICVKLFTRKARITGIDAPVKSERKDTSARPRLTEAQIMDKMRELMGRLGVKSAIPGPKSAIPGPKNAIFASIPVIDVTPAKFSEDNVAVLPEGESGLEHENRRDEQQDEQ